MKIDIDDVIGVRKNRSQLFNEQYFANKFWDIILVLYSQEVNDLPINAQGISSKLDIDQGKVLRYLKVLSADNLVCAYDQMAEDQFNIADDNLSLTRAGFENTATVIQQMRRVFGQSENQHS